MAVTVYKSVTEEGPLQDIPNKPLLSSSVGYLIISSLESSDRGGTGFCQGLWNGPLHPYELYISPLISE